MKLYNRTKVEDTLMALIMKTAAKAAKVRRTGQVLVQINNGQRGLSGEASGTVRWVKIGGYGREIKCQGWLRVVFPLRGFNHPSFDKLQLAEKFWAVCVHEWAHIADSQNGLRFGSYNKRWAERPHEARACYAAKYASANRSTEAEQAILDLALLFSNEGCN